MYLAILEFTWWRIQLHAEAASETIAGWTAG
jgi:hypothetical protein